MKDSTILKLASILSGGLLSALLIVYGFAEAGAALAGALVAYTISETNGNSRTKKAVEEAINETREEWRR